MIELLIVMAIIGVISSISIIAISGGQKSGDLNRSSSQLEGIIQLAKARAASTGRWYWVGIKPDATRNTLQVRLYMIPDTYLLKLGTATPGERDSKDYLLEGVILNAALPAGGGRPTADQNLPTTGAWLVVAPQGEVRLDITTALWAGTAGSLSFLKPAAALDRWIEIGLVTIDGSTTNYAAIQVAGLTGNTEIYRP